MIILENKNKGFTIIELIVVISIITILSSIIFININNVRIKSRDVKRIADLKQIQKALELYKIYNGDYPKPVCGTEDWCNSYESNEWDSLAFLLSDYMKKFPVDPLNNRGDPFYGEFYSYAYHYNDINGKYDLVCLLENKESPYRCGIKKYLFFGWGGQNGNRLWCGDFSEQLYSPQ
jgi:general secretion pathway protein G